MEQLIVVFSTQGMFPETRYICDCGRIMTFFSSSPSYCFGCRKKLCDLNGLKFNPNVRVKWHTRKEGTND